MKYELVQKLKDAEFPQVWPKPDYLPLDIALKIHDLKQPYEPDVYIPTLSELIKECGEEFNQVIRVVDSKEDRESRKLLKWMACGDDPENKYKVIYLDGSTPEEAVANLWLALKKN